VQEQQGGSPVANLLTGLGIDEYLTRTDAAGASHVLTDGLASTIALADATGAVPTTYTYEPFGATTISGTATTNSFEYTGRENDGTGLKYYRARYYHPQLQRFISEDPIGFVGSATNLYAYVGGSPIGFSDPLGLARIPFADMVRLVTANNRSGFSNELILCVSWTESSHDPAARHKSRTELGLMGITAGAAKDVGFAHSSLADPGRNIAAGSAYLALRVGRAGGSVEKGLRGYGTGSTYPVEKILDCENCLKRIPDETRRCTTAHSANAQECLARIHP